MEIVQIKDPILRELHSQSLSELVEISSESIFQSLHNLLEKQKQRNQRLIKSTQASQSHLENSTLSHHTCEITRATDESTSSRRRPADRALCRSSGCQYGVINQEGSRDKLFIPDKVNARFDEYVHIIFLILSYVLG